MTTIDRPTKNPVPMLRTAAFVSSVHGPLVATLELHGVLCAVTAAQLRRELAQLIEEGIDDIVIDLRDLDLCTSDGVNVFTEANAALTDRDRGSVQLCRERGVTRRVLDVIDAGDPTFDLQRVTGGPDDVAP
jgi:anti-anti-sigma factor